MTERSHHAGFGIFGLICFICGILILSEGVSASQSWTFNGETYEVNGIEMRILSLQTKFGDENAGSSENPEDPEKINAHDYADSRRVFQPGPGNDLTLELLGQILGFGSSDQFELKLRVLNPEGKMVYSISKKQEELAEDMRSGTQVSFQAVWDGKAKKGNAAGIPAGTYVPEGTYTVEAVLKCTLAVSGKKPGKVRKTIPLQVSSESSRSSEESQETAPGQEVERGLLYTGNLYIDYIAELMLKEAGLESSMDADTKVKLIYHYMTTHFHHMHSIKNAEILYDVKALRPEIVSFRKETDRKVKKGLIIYSNRYSSTLWHMVVRGGVCSDNAACFAVLLNHAGIEAGTCRGQYINMDGSRPGHSWNYAIIDGTKWYYDVDVEIQNYGKGQGDYYWYRKSRTEAEKTHAFSSES